MAFVVENGTGLANANAYIDVAFADAYFADRGNTTWAALSTDQKQQNIIKATDYIELRFSSRFKGQKVNDAQALSFPRTGVPCAPDSTVVPTQIQRATAEYAVRAQAGPLAPDPTIDPSGKSVTMSRKKVGPIEKETRFSESTGEGSFWLFKPYPAADSLLSCLVYASQGRVIRN